jgi:hypothetical protein
VSRFVEIWIEDLTTSRVQEYEHSLMYVHSMRSANPSYKQSYKMSELVILKLTNIFIFITIIIIIIIIIHLTANRLSSVGSGYNACT